MHGAFTRRFFPAAFLALVGAATSACGGSSPSSPSVPNPPNTAPVVTTTITITSAGASPQNIQISQGQRVLIINNDSRSHNMTSNPHPEHTDCPEINQIGLLAPGQSRESGNMNTIRTCGFHDHDNPTSATLVGTVVIR